MIPSFRILIIVLILSVLTPVLGQYADDYNYTFPDGSGYYDYDETCGCNLTETAIVKTIKLPIGWPLLLACQLSDIPISILPNNSILQCHVIDEDNHVTLLEQTETITKFDDKIVYMKSEVEGNSSAHYRITTSLIGDDVLCCTVIEVQLQVEEFKQETCQEALQNSHGNDHVHTTYRHDRTLDCEGHGALFEKAFFENMNDYEVNWYRNCSSKPITSHLNSNNELKIVHVEFEDAGVYTCAVTYHGMTLYASSHRMCVQQAPKSIPPVILCPEEGKLVEGELGENVLVSMKVAVGSGHFPKWDFYAVWRKSTINGSMMLCDNNELDWQEPERISCLIQQSVGDSCFYHIAGEEERKSQENRLTSTLNITNLQPDDFGEYFLELTSLAHIDHTSARCRIRVVKQSKLQQWILIFIFLILFLLLVGLGTIGYFKVFFKVHYKRRFGKKHQDCYNVFISYHATDMEVEEREQLKILIDVCDAILTKLGCQIVVENRDGNSPGESQIKTIEDLAMDSDLVVLILTSCGALEDAWSVSKFQKIYERSLDSKMEIFFVVSPEIRGMIKKEENSNCVLIKKAMKENHVMEWDGEERISCRRRRDYWLRLELENVIPKIGRYHSIPKIQFNVYSADKFDGFSTDNI